MISRLTVACALALGLLTFAASAQAAPPEFNWSSSVSTTQAGGHPTLTLNYSSSSTQSLTRLDVDLPHGLMHRNNLNGACSNALYLADNCPASSTIGSVSTQIVVARIAISVPGTIYQLSAPDANTNATLGIVLRPPLSGLGLTGKIFIRNQLSFINGGGLRSSLVGPLDSVKVLGVTLPARIAQLKLQYNSQTPTGSVALISNPTSCKPQTFTAVGTYSSQSPRERSSSFTTTGCQAVPFAPTADVKFSNFTAGQKTAVLVAMGNPGGGSSGALHPGHISDFWNDWQDVLSFDLEAISSGPLCTDVQAASSTCPAGSQFGEFSVDIEGFGTASGKSFVTNSPGHKTVNEITIRPGVTVRFDGEIGRSSLSFTGLPQLPFTAIRFKTTADSAWITNTCAIRTSRAVLSGHSGGWSSRTVPLPAPTCPDTTPPALSFVGDDYIDADNDGIADKPFRDQDFSFEFAAADAASGLDLEKLTCAIEPKDPSQPTTRGKTRPSYTSGRFHCDFVAASGGPGTISLTAFDHGGHVTVLKLSVIIDVSPPKIAIKEQGVRYSDAASPEIEFTAEDDSLRHDQGELEISCERKGWDGTVKGGSSRIITDRDTGRSKGFCVFPDTPEGSYKVTVQGWDPVKKQAVAETDLVVDRSAPVVTLTNPEDADADGDGIADNRFRSSDLDVLFDATDDGSGVNPNATSCLAKVVNKGVVKGNVTFNNGNRTCSLTGLPDGDVEVELSVSNYVGTVTIVKRGFTVDTTPPTLSFTDIGDLDSDGDGFSDNRVRAARLGYEIHVEDARGSGVDPNSASCVAKPRKGGMVHGNINVMNGSLLRCSFESLPSGDTDIEISAADHRGHVTVLKAAVTIEDSP